MLRSRVLAQLLGIRGQLDSVPAMLASVNRESELLDNPDPTAILKKEEEKAAAKAEEQKESADSSS